MRENKIHFIGIGGIGVSALAQWYKSEGWQVTGSDATRSLIADDLKRKGITVNIGVHPKIVNDKVNRIVFSAAVPEDHPERKKARKLNIPEYSYAEALGELTRRYWTIAVCGAHGKSTTTAMVALMMIRARLDPAVIIGTRLKEFGNSNFHKGRSPWLVFEADEYHNSFLNYHPFAAVATNVDREHLDFYKTISRVKRAFRTFLEHVNPYGVLVLNNDDPYLRTIKLPLVRIKRYSLKSSRAKELAKVLKVPGKHNLSNALAADAFGEAFGIPKGIRTNSLASFGGTWRRFEYKGKFKNASVYDDYGHHPSEIRATLAGARELFPKERIWCVFQPHHQERLRILFSDFTRAFRGANKVVIVETYKVRGREQMESYKGKDAKALAKSIKGAFYAKNQRAAFNILKEKVERGDVIIVMGAGDITELSNRLVKNQ